MLGEHDGTFGFTVGQRRGLGVAVGAPDATCSQVDAPANRVVVGPEELLARRGLDRRPGLLGRRRAAVEGRVRGGGPDPVPRRPRPRRRGAVGRPGVRVEFASAAEGRRARVSPRWSTGATSSSAAGGSSSRSAEGWGDDRAPQRRRGPSGAGRIHDGRSRGAPRRVQRGRRVARARCQSVRRAVRRARGRDGPARARRRGGHPDAPSTSTTSWPTTSTRSRLVHIARHERGGHAIRPAAGAGLAHARRPMPRVLGDEPGPGGPATCSWVPRPRPVAPGSRLRCLS